MANLRVDKITSTETFETTGSVQFDGVDDGLTISDNAAFDLGTGDFTIEGWYYLVNAGTYQSLMDWRGSGADGNYPALFRNNTGNYIYYYVDSAVRITNVEISHDTWFHVSICRFSGITKLFIDGKEKGSFADTISYVSRDILLGLSSSNSNDIKGNISNYRVIKGIGLYTSDFKPPMRELEVTPETVLLACQSKTDATLEKTGKTITANGNAVACELTPGILTPIVKSGGGSAITGSVEFDGTGDYLSLPDSIDLIPGSNIRTTPSGIPSTQGDFTIEFWRYKSRVANLTGAESYVTKYNNVLAGSSFWFGALTNGRESFYWYSGSNEYSVISANNVAQVGEWGHLAAVRYNGVITLYLNGIAIASTGNAIYINEDSNPLIIGGDNYSGAANTFQGSISNLRIVNGTALYTGNFTPPTRELKKVPGTVLLCCQDENSITTEAIGKTITGYGDPAPSNFTPQVGDDRKVTFEGVTKINSDAYFYLPTGNTESRDKGAGTRGISMGGSGASGAINTIQYINISTTGNAINFGALPAVKNQQASAASSTRGISAGGYSSNESATVSYITIASTGDAKDFGDLTLARRLLVGCSSQTRGIFAGGYDAPNHYNTMDYITIASTGDALDFGDMVADGQTASGRYSSAGYASPTRGVWHGGYGAPAYRNIIDYATIASKGNTKDFGDSSISNYYLGGCSNSIRGISGGAWNPNPAHLNLIEYTTIATTGNAQDFGDLIQPSVSVGACASQIRGVFLGGYIGASKVNNISYVTLMSMGNAIDFGDLTAVVAYNTGCSNGHGGLG